MGVMVAGLSGLNLVSKLYFFYEGAARWLRAGSFRRRYHLRRALQEASTWDAWRDAPSMISTASRHGEMTRLGFTPMTFKRLHDSFGQLAPLVTWRRSCACFDRACSAIICTLTMRHCIASAGERTYMPSRDYHAPLSRSYSHSCFYSYPRLYSHPRALI